MDYKLINIFLFILNIFHILSSEFISGNPIKIIDKPYPVIFYYNDEFYNIITSGKVLTLNKTDGSIKTIEIKEYTPPFFVFKTSVNIYLNVVFIIQIYH